jgi:hypothetical protein
MIVRSGRSILLCIRDIVIKTATKRYTNKYEEWMGRTMKIYICILLRKDFCPLSSHPYRIK